MDLDNLKSALLDHFNIPKYWFLFGNTEMVFKAKEEISLITVYKNSNEKESKELAKLFSYFILNEIVKHVKLEKYTYDINAPFIKCNELIYITNDSDFYSTDKDYIIYNPLINGTFKFLVNEPICNLELDIFDNKFTYNNNKLSLEIVIY